MVAWVCSSRVMKAEGSLEICDLAISGLSNTLSQNLQTTATKWRLLSPEANSWPAHEGTRTHMYIHIHIPTTHIYCIHAFIYISLYIDTHTHSYNMYIYMQTFIPTNMYTEKNTIFVEQASIQRNGPPSIDYWSYTSAQIPKWQNERLSLILPDSRRAKTFSIAGQTALVSHKKNNSNERIELSTLRGG